MNTLSFTLDGMDVQALEGETILQAVRRLGFSQRIPTLCYEPALPPYTSCYLCVVEVEGVHRLLPACSAFPSEGMKVRTSTPRVEEARKTALELLMSNHPADCVAPCSRGCPAGIDVQRYLALAGKGLLGQAIMTIREHNPLPLVCGRVCVRKCEEVCRRTYYDEPVGINMVKRSVSDWWFEHPYDETPLPPTGKRVAIVGGGPAGLTAAYFLRMKGHEVTIYEMQHKLGGMLRWGIPDYRLPQHLLDFEIGQILKLGVEVHTGVWVGPDLPLANLRSQFDAVFIAIGAQLGSEAHMEGEEHPSVLTGVEFLDTVKKHQQSPMTGRRVVVVGGGNTAIDASRTSLRLGAEHVTILYRRTRQEMPANPEEIHGAEEEGVRIEFLIAPLRVVTQDDVVTGLVCEKMQLGDPDASGRRRPVPVAGSSHFVACDVVITAIGQKVDLSGLVQNKDGLGVSRWGTVSNNAETLQTTLADVFAGGDAVSGPAVVIDAIGDGRKAALSIHHYLTVGRVDPLTERFASCRENFGEIRKAELPPAPAFKRHHLTTITPDERRTSFGEVELTLEDYQTVEEAGRCLSCGCAANESCELRALCERYGLPTTINGQTRIHPVDRAHPYIVMDPNKCILCTRCVRTCGDILGVSALGLVNRGFDTLISPTLGRPLLQTDCVSCGNCVEACPTGALSFKDRKRSDLPEETCDSVCTLCGELCTMKVGRNQFGVSFRTERGQDGKRLHLCGLGRFGNEVYMGPERIRSPYIRRGSTLVPCSYAEALQAAVNGISEIRKRFGPDSLLVAGGPDLTCQEAAWLAQLGKETLGARTASLSAVAQDAELYSLDATFGATGSTVSYRDLEAAALILVVGEDPTARNPVAGARLRRALRNGAKVLSIVSSSTPIRWLASTHLQVSKGSASMVLGWLARRLLQRSATLSAEASVARDALAYCTSTAVQEASGVSPHVLEQALELLLQAQGPIVAVYPIDWIEERSPDSPLLLAQILEMCRPASPGSGLLFTQSGPNLLGLKMAGLLPQTQAEYISLVESLQRQEIRGAWLVRENPLLQPMLTNALQKVEFLVVQGTFLTETAQRANVVFPASTHLESGGSFVRSDGRVLSAPACLPSVSPVPNTQLFQEACLRFGLEDSGRNLPAILQESLARCSGTFHVRHHFRWIPARPGTDSATRNRASVSSAQGFIRRRLPVKV